MKVKSVLKYGHMARSTTRMRRSYDQFCGMARGLDIIGERVILPPPSGSAVYQLTAAGEGLAPALNAIGRWGAQFLRGGPKKTDTMVPRSYFVAMRGTFNPEAAGKLRATYELRVNGLVFEVRIGDGRIT